jgi:hypothetical protein
VLRKGDSPKRITSGARKSLITWRAASAAVRVRASGWTSGTWLPRRAGSRGESTLTRAGPLPCPPSRSYTRSPHRLRADRVDPRLDRELDAGRVAVIPTPPASASTSSAPRRWTPGPAGRGCPSLRRRVPQRCIVANQRRTPRCSLPPNRAGFRPRSTADRETSSREGPEQYRQLRVIAKEVTRPPARHTSCSPKVRISTPSTVRRCDRPSRLPSFAAIAGVAGVLAAGQIRGDLQAHLALPRAGEEPPLVDADLAPGPDGGCFIKPFRLGRLTQFLDGAELH